MGLDAMRGGVWFTLEELQYNFFTPSQEKSSLPSLNQYFHASLPIYFHRLPTCFSGQLTPSRESGGNDQQPLTALQRQHYFLLLTSAQQARMRDNFLFSFPIWLSFCILRHRLVGCKVNNNVCLVVDAL